jgi:WD40 repeat protein
MMQTRMIRFLAAVAGVVAGIGAGQAAGPPPRSATLGPAATAGVGEKPRLDRHGAPLPEGAVARLGTLRWRAAGEVEALGFWPDGRTLAAVSRHGARLFTPDGRVLRHFPHGDTPDIAILGLSPDGKRVAVVGQAGEGKHAGKRAIQVWGLMEGRKLQEYPSDFEPIWPRPWLWWSADSEPVVVLATKDAVIFRELATGRDRRLESAVAVNHLEDVAYAPKAGVLVARDRPGTFHVWNTATGKEVRTFPWKDSFIRQTALSPDGTTLAVLMEKDGVWLPVRLVEVATGKVRHTLAADQKQLAGVLFSPDGKTLATFGTSEVRLYDPATGREQDRLPDGASQGHVGAFSPDGRTLASVKSWNERVIRVRDRAGKALRASPEGHTSLPWQIDFSADGSQVASGGFYDEQVFVWDSATGRLVLRLPGNDRVGSGAFSADGTSIFSLRRDSQIDVIDIRSGRTLQRLKGPDSDRAEAASSPLSLHLSADRRNLVRLSLVDSDRRGEVDLQLTGWDATTRKSSFQRRRKAGFWGKVSPDLRVLAVDSALGEGTSIHPGSGPVHVEALATGEHLFDLPKLPHETSPVAFSACGRLLVTSTLEYIWEGKSMFPTKDVETRRLWEVASAEEVLSFPITSNHMIAFSPDGRLLALGGEDRQVLLYDLRRGRELRCFRGFDAAVTRLAFSPDGGRLVSGLEDSTLLVWDVTRPDAGKPGPADPAVLNRAWADLAGDAKKAFAARNALADWPVETVALLRGRLQPIRPTDPAELRRLLADLDSDTFAVREKAQARLRGLEESAADALREALRRKPSLEARRRLEALLARLRGPIPDRETLRVMRAIAVLEDIGTAGARAVLKTLAGGAEAARQTQEARRVLDRLERSRK